MRLHQNPLGRRLQDVELVRVGKGNMVHVRHPLLPGTLCMPSDSTKDLRKRPTMLIPVEGEVVTCYRCLKLMAINQSLRGKPTNVGGVDNLLEEAYARRANG